MAQQLPRDESALMGPKVFLGLITWQLSVDLGTLLSHIVITWGLVTEGDQEIS